MIVVLVILLATDPVGFFDSALGHDESRTGSTWYDLIATGGADYETDSSRRRRAEER